MNSDHPRLRAYEWRVCPYCKKRFAVQKIRPDVTCGDSFCKNKAAARTRAEFGG